MTEAGFAVERAPVLRVRSRRSAARAATLAVFWGVVLGNAATIVWLWWHGGNVTHLRSTGDILTSIARITGLLGAYLALLQVVLLSRLPWLERILGFDRLTFWHRWNGHATLDLVLAHVFFSIWGYAALDKVSIPKEIRTMLGGGVYPGMIAATVGTALFVAVVLASIVIVRRRLRYEWWYGVHITAYAAIALAWFHQIPTGNELVLDQTAADYWRALYAATLALLLVFRLGVPIVNAFRYRLRVSEVVPEGPGVVSLTMTGRNLDRLDARAGQFFIWRFMSRERWLSPHPFSLSRAPDGRSLRITVKALGDFTRKLGAITPGTRVVAEGPFGVFTADARRRRKVLLIAGGIGMTPIRALMEELEPGAVVIYRVMRHDDVVFRNELEPLAREREIELLFVAGDHATPEGALLLTPAHLRELVPDIRERDVYVCGPPAMTDAIERNVRATGVSRRYIHTERFAL